MTVRFGMNDYWEAPRDVAQSVGQWLATLDHSDSLSHESPFGFAVGPAVDAIEWEGEGYRIRGWPPGLPTDETGNPVRRWIVPSSPPPVEALRYAMSKAATP